MQFKDLRELAAFLEGAPARAQAAMVIAAKETATELLTIAHETFGEDPPLATLADSTQEERMQLGYEPDAPLLRDGTLRDSVAGYTYEKPNGAVAGIISDDPRMYFHEFGYETQPFGNPNARITPVPPRPVFRETTLEILPFVVEQCREIARAVLDPEARK